MPWTPEEVIEAIAVEGEEVAAVARGFLHWATVLPETRIAGGRGVSYPSLTIEADTGRSKSRYRGVLSLYASPRSSAESPVLEVRIKRMCGTPPYNRTDTRTRLIADLRALDIPHLNSEADLADKRPNIPLAELTGGRAESLLSLVNRWIDDVRAHVGEPETADESS